MIQIYLPSFFLSNTSVSTHLSGRGVFSFVPSPLQLQASQSSQVSEFQKLGAIKHESCYYLLLTQPMQARSLGTRFIRVSRLLGACECAALYRIHSEYNRFKSYERILYVEGCTPKISQVQLPYPTLSKQQLNIDWGSPSSQLCSYALLLSFAPV